MEVGKGVVHSVTQHMGVCSYVTRYLEYMFGYASFEVPRIIKFGKLCWSMLTCCAGKNKK